MGNGGLKSRRLFRDIIAISRIVMLISSQGSYNHTHEIVCRCTRRGIRSRRKYVIRDQEVQSPWGEVWMAFA
jgi:hypothetical protein